MTIKSAPNLKKTDYNIPGLGVAREIVRWSYKANEGDLSEEVFMLEDKFVIINLVDIKEEGLSDIKDIRTEIEVKVKEEKKAGMIIEKIKKAYTADASLESIGQSTGREVETFKTPPASLVTVTVSFSTAAV